MTDKEAVQLITEHFSTPGAQLSKDPDTGQCFYRFPEDPSRKCAVGVLIPDDQYIPLLEEQGADELAENLPALRGLSPDILSEIQGGHGGSRDVEDFLGWLVDFSERHGTS